MSKNFKKNVIKNKKMSSIFNKNNVFKNILLASILGIFIGLAQTTFSYNKILSIESNSVSISYNRVFATSQKFQSNLEGLQGADEKCQVLAQEANLFGTYKAWLSDSQTNAQDRIPNTQYGLVDGTLIAKNKNDLLDGQLQHSINLDEYGRPLSDNSVPEAGNIWTGTNRYGNQWNNYFCNNWAFINNTDSVGGSGNSNHQNYSWTENSVLDCRQSAHLYCFQSDTPPTSTSTLTPTVSSTITPTPLPLMQVFVSSLAYNGDLEGLAGADDKCQYLALDANLEGTYRAWLSTSSQNAKDRIPDAHYVLVNGTTIASSKSDLLDGMLENKINLNEQGTPTSTGVWTGTKSDGTKSYSMCNNWTSPYGTTGGRGNSNYTNTWWTEMDGYSCNGYFPLYCFQVDQYSPPTPSTSTFIKQFRKEYIYPISLEQTADEGFFALNTSVEDHTYLDLLLKINSLGDIESVKHFDQGTYYNMSTSTKTTTGDILLGGSAGYLNPDLGLIKLDSSLNPIWAKTYDPSTLYQQATIVDLIESSTSDIFSLGLLDMGGSGDNYSLIMKLNSSGSLQWKKIYEYDEFYNLGYPNYFSHIIEKSSNEIIVAGEYMYYVPGGTYQHLVLAKLNTSGDIIWAKKTDFGYPDYSMYPNLIKTNDGGYTILTNGGHIFIFDATDTLVWRKDINDIALAQDIKQTIDGNYIVSAVQGSYPNFQPIIIKLNHNGDFLWAKALQTTNASAATNIIQTADGGYALMTEKDDGSLSDLLLVKTDAYGNLVECDETIPVQLTVSQDLDYFVNFSIKPISETLTQSSINPSLSDTSLEMFNLCPGFSISPTLTPTISLTPTMTTTPGDLKVFVSSQEYTGNLNGLSGGDEHCQTLAMNAGLPGTYNAMLSTSTLDAKDRIPNAHYVLVNGTSIADSKSDLFDGSVDNKINLNEQGTPVISPVWTGTLSDGTKSDETKCNNWLSNSGSITGRSGNSDYTNEYWIQQYYASCNSSKRLYCFQVS